MKSRKFTVLAVDDEEHIRTALKRLFRRYYRDDVDVLEAEDGVEALKQLDTRTVDMAVVDLRMPRMDGMTLLARMREEYPDVPVLILSGHGTVKDAVKALGIGAADFLEKPFEGEELVARLEQFRRIWELRGENERLREEMSFTFGYEKLVGSAPPLLEIKRLVAQAGPSGENVLIQGETGTGKELVARALHFHSPRRHGAFVPVDCASLSPTVVESELFGYVRGAFTGAVGSAPGLLRAADGGTVFFDEIGELPLPMQAKLLRVIQEREVRPVGGTKPVPVDIRVLAATNRDLASSVAAGEFREDLYYRLNVILLRIPPLRERKEDIPTLSRYFLERGSPGAVSIGIGERALECLESYDWPGNVRELENVLRRAAALRSGPRIDAGDLPPHIAASRTAERKREPAPGHPQAEGAALSDFELNALRRALEAAGGNRRKAAQALGIGEATLYRKIKKYGLSRHGSC